MTIEQLYSKVVDYFTEAMPVAETELKYNTTFGLLVAVVLSAQCTDKRVNMVTPALLSRYPDARSMSEASVADVLSYVKSVSYPNSKSRHLVELSKVLCEKFGGEVPCVFDDLISLPGVGRKTANVIVSVAFGQQAIAVDTHVFRVAERIGLTKNSKSPYETERQLVKYLPNDKLGIAHHWLILHGRYVCTARNPKCGECGIADFCHYSVTNGR